MLQHSVQSCEQLPVVYFNGVGTWGPRISLQHAKPQQ